MKATLLTKDLQKALARLKPICSGAASLPILNMVLLSPTKEGLRLTAHNLDTELSVVIPAQMVGDEAAAVPGTRLLAAAARISAEEVDLSWAKRELIMEAGDWRVKLYTLSSDEFPASIQVTAHAGFAVPAEILAAMLRAALRFVCTDETRYTLNGVLFTVDAQDGGRLQLVATEGRRLYQSTLQAEVPPMMACIVAAEAVKRLVDMSTDEQVVNLRMGENTFEATAGEWTLRGRLIEGNFPNFAQVIPPRGAKHQLRIPRRALLAALPFVECVMGKADPSLRLKLEADHLTVEMQQPDVGEARVGMDAGVDGGELEVAFNAHFMLDVLNSFAGEEVTMQMADAMSPLLIEEAGTLAVMMPMRVEGASK